jgi:tRNA modification GTPase
MAVFMRFGFPAKQISRKAPRRRSMVLDGSYPEKMAENEQETIVAISTPPGRGGIGVVRLSGPHPRDIVAPLLRLRHPLAAGRARFGEVLDIATDAVLDQCVATYFAAPHSYTGEDVVEIAMHSSPVLLDYVLRQCCSNGARLAEPGEFTQRAFLAGRIDLAQAEAVADLIGSSTLEQARLAARQLGGALSHVVSPIKADLVALIAALEAGIDFAEDDIDVLPAHIIAERIAAIRAPLQGLEQSFAYGRIVRDGFKLAIVGRPNAGKSSLFNRLVQRDRAIVTSTPGTTRDLVTERVALEGIPVDLIDTAGLRDSTDEAERLGIAKSHQAIADADVVLLVLDAPALAAQGKTVILSEGVVDAESKDLRFQLPQSSALIVALNKIDLQPEALQSQTANLQPATCNLQPIPTSALTGEGIPQLRAAIVAAVAGPDAALRESGMLTNLRQHQAVEQALRSLASARAAVADRIPHEMLLLDLYAALRALDALTGATTTEDVLRLIFSTFCIGK